MQMLHVAYNHKSDFGNAWSTGSQRFRNEVEFSKWLSESIAQYGAVLVTEYRWV